MQTLNVALAERSYPIHIGAGLLARPELIVEKLPQKRPSSSPIPPSHPSTSRRSSARWSRAA